MRKLLTWVLVSLGIAALVRKLRSRNAEPEAVPGLSPSHAPTSAELAEQPEDDDPAGEFRQKLAESRGEREAPAAPAGSVEERRAEVHEQGRAALDEMQPSEES